MTAPADEKAFIEVKDGRYFLGVWFLTDEREGDVMVAAFRDGPDPGEWHVRYRFRYYRDGKAFGSKDVKSQYGFCTKDASEAKVLEVCNALVAMLSDRYPKVDARMVRSASADVFLRIAMNRSWAHKKVMKV